MLGLHILDQWLEIRAETFRFGRYCTDGNGLWAQEINRA
jgi:hypothetical protein